jgi:hypothetical protein
MFDLLPIGARAPLIIGLAYFLVAIGIAAIGFTVAMMRGRLPPPDPFASPFGDVPKLPDVADEAERIWS